MVAVTVAGVDVRPARQSDVDAILDQVDDLLRELSGDPDRPRPAGAESAARVLVDDPAAVVLVAEAGAKLVGLLTASPVTAIRTGGRYLLIQELSVRREARSAAVGAALLARLAQEATRRGFGAVEVGLPGSRYPHRARTHGFYISHGFSEVGARMRLSLKPPARGIGDAR